jgi:hypothetical protein
MVPCTYAAPESGHEPSFADHTAVAQQVQPPELAYLLSTRFVWIGTAIKLR